MSATLTPIPSLRASSEEPVTIVLADDHKVVRQGLRMLLNAEPGIEVVDEAGDVESTLRKVLGYRPSVVILDLNMPGETGLSAIPRIAEISPETAVVILTMQDEPRYAREALRAGALGYVLKEAADIELVEAVRLAAAGQTYLNPRLGARLASESPTPVGPPDELSERETQVLTKIALGYTNAEIAEQLFLSVRTVESHRSRIQQKTACTSRAELVAYARRHGLDD